MDNKVKTSRFGFRSKLTSLFLSAVMMTSAFTGLGGALTSTYAMAVSSTEFMIKDQQKGSILQCFNWSFNAIKQNMAKIAEQGFTAVQTSPIQTAKEGTVGKTAKGSWWVQYQPADFTIETNRNGTGALGTASEFKAMCDEAHKYGVRVIVDAVLNHMANKSKNDLSPTIPDEYRNNSSFWHDISKNSWYASRYDITQYCMDGVPDLNTSNEQVQNAAIKFLKECIDCGADGFRFDGAKHIETPADSNGSNFWPNVLNTTTKYAESTRGVTPYYYGEVLDKTTGNDDAGSGQNIANSYTSMMSITLSSVSNGIRGAVNSSNADGAKRSDFGLDDGSKISGSRAVLWNESHDTYQAGTSSYVSDYNMNKTWALVGTRAEACGMYLARPSNWGSAMMGQGDVTAWANKEVKEVNLFHNYFAGQSEYLSSSNGIVYNERGTDGVVLVNVPGGSASVSVASHKMKDGTYTDKITGNKFTVSGGQISGQIGDTGIAVVYNGENPPPVNSSVSASPATGTTFTDTLTVTLNSKNATNTTYTTSEGASGSFTDGQKITVGKSTAEGQSVTVTVKGTSSNKESLSNTYIYTKRPQSESVSVYMDNTSYKWSNVYAYVYTGDGASAKAMTAWPGVKMTEKNSAGYFKLDVTGFEDGLVIFSDGTNSAANRYPADMQPGLKISGSSKLFSEGNTWSDYKDEPIVKDPLVKVDKASGTSFNTETFDITLTLENAESGTYSVDNGPVKSFTGTKTVTIGEGKIADSDITVKTTAANGTNTKEYVFKYNKKYVMKTSSTSAASASSKYATNPGGNVGARKTIKSAGDFTADTLIAQGVANDDPAAFKGTHEAPKFDLYALYAAWDDTNIYVGIQYTNVIDVVDPVQEAPQTGRGKPNGADADIPQMILFDTKTGDYTDGTTNDTKQTTVWDTNITFGGDTKVDRILMYSPKKGIDNYAVFPVTNGIIDYTNKIGDGYQKPLDGASVVCEDGFFCSAMNGIKAVGYDPSELESDSSQWVDFLSTNHSKEQDTFCIVTLPLKYLNISANDIETKGLGIMAVATYGESGMGCLPHDTVMLDNVFKPYKDDISTSGEKSDADEITVALASVGKSGSPVPPKPTSLQVNFGTDRSAPQLSDTALTIKGIGYGGTAPYKYKFTVDGTVIKNTSTTDNVSWKPKTAGKHTLECVITDSAGNTYKATKTFTSEGGVPPTDLTNNSKISADSISAGGTVTATGSATGGTAPYQYQIVYRKSGQTKWTTALSYGTNNTAKIKPASTGTYEICIKVKDSQNAEVKKFFTVQVKPSPLTNTSTISSLSISKGDSLKVTASGKGGTGSYQYQVVYKKDSDTKWYTAQAYGKNTSVSIKPASEGKYNVCVKVKDSDGTEVKKFFDVTVVSPPAIQFKISSTKINLGESVNISVTAPSTCKIAAYYKQVSQSKWTEKQAFSTNKNISIKPAKATQYNVCVKVRDSEGNITKKYFNVDVVKGLVNTSSLSSTSISLGETLTAKCSATGGSGYYNFAVYYKRTSQTKWTTAQNYKSNTGVTFKPAAATTYDVCVKAKDSNGTEVKKYFTVKVNNAELRNTSTVSPSTLKMGVKVTVKASATGGTGSYKYAVYCKKTSQTNWTEIQAFSTNSTVSITPASATPYKICVKVKDSDGTIEKKYFDLKVTA